MRITQFFARLGSGSVVDRVTLVLLVIATATVNAAYYQLHGPALNGLLILSVLGVAFDQPRGRLAMPDIQARLVSGVFLVYVLIALLSASRVGFNPEAIDRLENFTYFLAAVFLVPFLRRLRLPPGWFWFAVGAAAALSGLYAAWELLQFGPEHRAGGSKGKSIPFGDLATLASLLSLLGAGVFIRSSPARAALLAAAALLGGYASLASETRGAWVLLPMGFAVVLLYLYRTYPDYRRRLVLSTLVLSLGAIAAVVQTDTFRVRLTQTADQIADYQHQSRMTSGNALGERVEMWQLGLAAFREHPILGIGVGQLNGYFRAAVQRGDASPVIAQYDNGTGHTHAHNDYVHVLATRGLLGLLSLLLLYFGLLGVFVRGAGRAARGEAGAGDRGLAYAGVLVVLGYMHFSLTDSVLLMRVTSGFFVLTAVWLVALVLAADRQRKVEGLPAQTVDAPRD